MQMQPFGIHYPQPVLHNLMQQAPIAIQNSERVYPKEVSNVNPKRIICVLVIKDRIISK